MLLTPFGFKIPELKEQDWWDQLIFNINRTSSHTHDGVNTPKLAASSFSKIKSSISSANWDAGVSGHFKQSVALPSEIKTTDWVPIFIVDGGGQNGKQVHLSYKILDDSTIEVYSNNANLSLKVIYV